MKNKRWTFFGTQCRKSVMLPGVDVVGCERWKSCCRAANNCCRRQRSLRTKDSSSSSSSLFGMGEEQWSPVDNEVKKCASTWDGFSCWDSAHPGTSAGTLGYHLGHRIISWNSSCPSPDINWDSETSPNTLDHHLGLCPSWDINWDSGTLPIPGHRSDNRVRPTWNE